MKDNAAYWKSDLIKELTRLMGVDHSFSSPNRHEGNGQVERIFGTLHSLLRSYTSSNQLDWDEHLNACAFAYNTTTHSTTGETPFMLLFGRDPTFSAELIFQEPERPIYTGTDEMSIYKESLISSLQSAWAIAYDHTKQNRPIDIGPPTIRCPRTPTLVSCAGAEPEPSLPTELLS